MRAQAQPAPRPPPQRYQNPPRVLPLSRPSPSAPNRTQRHQSAWRNGKKRFSVAAKPADRGGKCSVSDDADAPGRWVEPSLGLRLAPATAPGLRQRRHRVAVRSGGEQLPPAARHSNLRSSGNRSQSTINRRRLHRPCLCGSGPAHWFPSRAGDGLDRETAGHPSLSRVTAVQPLRATAARPERTRLWWRGGAARQRTSQPRPSAETRRALAAADGRHRELAAARLRSPEPAQSPAPAIRRPSGRAELSTALRLLSVQRRGDRAGISSPIDRLHEAVRPPGRPDLSAAG